MFAVAALAACTSEQTIVAPQNEAIGFDTFVDNSTRANDVTTETIKDFGFGVYASVTNGAGQSGLILTNEEVSYDGAWGYSNTQYWVAGNDYNFTAIAPYTDAKWTYAPKDGKMAQHGVISFNNREAAANQDLVFASAARKVTEAPTSQPEAVKFTFNHMLSRVRFSFANGFQSAGNIELAVSNVHITDAYANGTLAVEDGAPVAAWTNLADKNLDVNFGVVAYDNSAVKYEATAAERIAEGAKLSSEYFYLIPNAEATAYEVTFDVTLFQAGVEIATYPHTVELKCAMNRGVSYDIKTTLTEKNTSNEEIYPIEFTVTAVEEWGAYNDVALEAKTVATAAELVAAIAEGGEIRLTKDINLDEVTTRAAAAGLVVDKDLILDGNGFTVKTTAVRALQFTEGANNVTIKNLTLDAPKSERGFQFQADGHNVVIENVTATSDNYTVYLTATSTNSNVVVKNCDLTGKNTINVWGKDHKVNVENTKITTIDNNTAEGYASVYNNADNTTVYVNGGEVVITGSANDSFGGVVTASGASIIFNGTEGTTTIEGQPFVINYDNGYTYSFSTFAEAVETAKDGETIVLCQDVQIDAPLSVSKKIVFDLNGKNISVGAFTESNGTISAGNTDSFAFWVKNGGDLTITGEGEISTAACDYSIAVWAQGGKVTINGGKFTNAGEGSDLIYASANGHVVINGGEFVACEKQDGVDGTDQAYSVLNLKGDNTGSSITCYGGRYYKFDPANNKSENPAVSFVAPGYESVVDGDYFKVVKL